MLEAIGGRMAKVFLTGATGYLGGEALYSLSRLRKPPHITCLIRDSEKASVVQKAYPNARIVLGDLDSEEIVEAESKSADVIFNLAATNHKKSAESIVRGLNSRDGSQPGYWIQISGASMFSGPDIKAGRYGEAPETEWDDVKDIESVVSTIKNNPARINDNIALAQDSTKVKTALIVGPLIYGSGNGPVKARSVQAPETARITLQNKEGFRLGKGLTVWSNVHIHDLGDLFAAVYEAAAENKKDLWNEKGIIFPENGQSSFGHLSELIAKEAYGQSYIPSPEVKKVVTPEEANKLMPHGAVLWGTNAVLKSSRARELLNWKPKGPELGKEIPRVVAFEAEQLGLKH